MNKKQRVGIYGGTFNPPHIGHIGAAESFVESARLDSLLIMPDYMPPHKLLESDVSASDRLEMSRLAFSHIDKVSISELEINRGGRSYTVLTLEELTAADRELFLLCGTDMFLTLSSWYRPEKIFELATICYVRRENDADNDLLIKAREKEYISEYGARIIPIPLSVKTVSSSEIRSAIKSGDGRVLELLPESVISYINKKGLYK